MPVYIFQNPETDEYVEVVQKMKDEHVYVDKDGLEWNRVWFVPNASVDTEINLDSARDFSEKQGVKI